ncbi:hypothetical protein HNQ80_000592 [Anaerosolibacter carboniphilus]|uniref:Uncharacterized protein n=1 Tax=Anaerosolibacter carboniphilus TaxID=1417629 RepID=A0A841KUA8_9FIRM|nr:hypothetical protein [Anaerosolibacter carboniphilus]MBB6214512.1 hypothetical protein [Anaerosolibacter carboniphilus]
MKKYHRRPLAILSKFGVTNLHRQNPYIVAWWAAAFPGFGHYLLNQYFRATLLTLTEVITNTLAHVNEAIVYTFCGDFERAKVVLQPRWALGYIIIYFYSIWDSYRSTLAQNKMCHLAELENERLDCMLFTSSEIQYLEQKKPATAAIYSFFFPGLGQLYNHRFGLAFYAMLWWWIYLTLSRAHESLTMIITGNIEMSIPLLHPHWLLFMPSVLGGSVYHAFITSKEHNRLFRLEQRRFLKERYQDSDVRIFD